MKEIININAVIYVMMFESHKQTLNTKHVIAVAGLNTMIVVGGFDE